MATKAVLNLALQIERKLSANYAEFLDECESFRADGFIPHYCEHGSNNWTDYDNICGYCEEGISMRDGVQRRREALNRAQTMWDEFAQGLDALQKLSALGIVDRHSDEFRSILDRVCAKATI